jgi:hypothetical protein
MAMDRYMTVLVPEEVGNCLVAAIPEASGARVTRCDEINLGRLKYNIN